MKKSTLSFPYLLFFLAILVAFPNYSQSDTAEYSVQFTGNWTRQSTPGGVVGGAHFTTIAGGKHNSSVSFWSPGATATDGLEHLAELGSTASFIDEINASPHTDASFTEFMRGGSGGGTTSFSLNVKRTHPLITLATMIGPSPDWFVGLHGYSLLDSSSNWVSSVTVNLYPYDAGTEDGTEFTLSNPETSPQGVITSLRNTGKFSNAPMATISFTRQDVPPPPGPTITEIERASNASQYTNANAVAWWVTFNEAVQNVSPDDFVVHNTTAVVTSLSPRSGSAKQYEMTVRGGNLTDLNAEISLGLSSFQDITNSSNTGLQTVLPLTAETYIIDNIAPRVSSVTPSRVEVSPFTATITFDEPLRSNTFSSARDVSSEDAKVSAPDGRGATYEVTVTPNNPLQASTISLSFPAGAGTDLAGNASVAHEAVIVYEPPIVVDSVSALTPDGLYHTGDELELVVTFSDAVIVTGTPRLTLQFESHTNDASYARGGGSNELIFDYTLISGDTTVDLGYVSEQALSLDNASIVGSEGQVANLTLPAPGSTGSLRHSSDLSTSGRQDSTPSFGDATIAELELVMNQQVDAIALPSAEGLDLPLRYHLQPALPAGLQLDVATHVISGTPTEELARTTFSWTVTDADDDTVTLTFSITVLEDLQPVFDTSATDAELIVTQDSEIATFSLPRAMSGNGALTYSLEPALPAGLVFDETSASISGIPTTPQSRTAYQWQVSDEDGDTAIFGASSSSVDEQPISINPVRRIGT